MRRTDRLRDDEEFINQVLDDAVTIFLAMMDGEYPYCLPLNFARVGRRLYMHCALEGRKKELLERDPHTAFAAALDVEIDRARSTTYFRSISGRGLASLVEDIEEKRMALDAIAEKYDAACKRPCPPEAAARTLIIRIDIEEIRGKRSARGKE